MSEKSLSFSEWAHEAERTVDERFLIFQLCEACRLLEYMRQSEEYRIRTRFRRFPYERWKEFYLNPLLVPEYSEQDTRRAEAMALYLTSFKPQETAFESRRQGDAGAVLRFFPALEEVVLGGTRMRDLSFLEALPNLRSLNIGGGELTDLSPFRKARSLRSLKLGLSGSGPPLFTPPVFWLDASPLGALTELEHLSFSPNPAVLAGLCFPKLTSAEFYNEHCVQPDCAHLPEMPELRLLKLGGVQSLRGIRRFPKLRHLTLCGPLRDFEDIEALRELDCLEVETLEGWPRDVTPLSRLPELMWARFSGKIPRNYWPLSQAPRLCRVEVEDVPAVALEVEAVNAVLRPWDEVFALREPRRVPEKLRFVAVAAGGDISALPKVSQLSRPEHAEHPRRFALQIDWMGRKAEQAARALLEDPEGFVYEASSSTHNTAYYPRFSIQTLEAAGRFPEILEALRGAMAWSPHDWHFSLYLNLRLREREMTEQQKKWLRQIESREDDWDDEDSLEIFQKTQAHIIETQFRKRQVEEGQEEADVEDFEPPEEIRPVPFSTQLVPAQGGGAPGKEDKDDDEEENPDFQLKPFDEQEQNDDEDDDGDGGVKTALSPDPPPDFLDDPYAHPLADSYRLFAILTLEGFFAHGNNLATVIQVLKREPDEYYPAPERP